MKRITIAIAALALVASACSKNEVLDNVSPSNAIGFKNLNDKVSSRAANDDNSNFGVYAVYSEGTTYGTGWFMNNTEVDANTYSYAPTKFWPALGAVDFYSYAPANSPNIDFSAVNYGSGANASFLVTYSVGNEASEDFTIADPQLGVNNKVGGAVVGLEFSHMLSQVQFNVAFDGATLDNAHYTLEVKNVELDVPSDVNTISLLDRQWGSNLSKSALYVPYTGAVNGGKYNILPQAVTVDDVTTLTIAVKITDNVTGEVYIDGNLEPIVLNGTRGGLTVFEKGKAYLFNVSIADTANDDNGTPVFSPIKFSSSLANWDEVSTDL